MNVTILAAIPKAMEEDFEDIGMNAAVDHAYHISELEKRNHEFDELCVEMRLFLESGDKKTLLLMISNLSMKFFSRSILDRMCNIAMDMNEFTESERERKYKMSSRNTSKTWKRM